MAEAVALKRICDGGGVHRLVLPDNPLNMVRCNGVSISTSKDIANLVKIDFQFLAQKSGGLVNISTMLGRVLEIGLANASAAMGRMMGGGLNG